MAFNGDKMEKEFMIGRVKGKKEGKDNASESQSQDT